MNEACCKALAHARRGSSLAKDRAPSVLNYIRSVGLAVSLCRETTQ